MTGATIHDSDDKDWYRITVSGTDPIPADTFLRLHKLSPEAGLGLSVYDDQGRLLRDRQSSEQVGRDAVLTFDLGGLPIGTYQVQIKAESRSPLQPFDFDGGGC